MGTAEDALLGYSSFNEYVYIQNQYYKNIQRMTGMFVVAFKNDNNETLYYNNYLSRKAEWTNELGEASAVNSFILAQEIANEYSEYSPFIGVVNSEAGIHWL